MEGTMSDASRASSRRWRTGVIMDPIAGIATYKDSTFAMLLEAQRRGHEIRYMEPADLTVQDGRALGRMAPLEVRDNADDWFTLGAAENRELAELDFLLMRKDPPFDMDYVYTTYILDLAEQAGVTVVTVLTKPYPCPGECVFCPTDVRMPKSYLPDEPGAIVPGRLRKGRRGPWCKTMLPDQFPDSLQRQIERGPFGQRGSLQAMDRLANDPAFAVSHR